jgi:AhpD family alkylhydroperoxidase
MFPDHTLDSAPPEARRTMAATVKHLGFLPAATARMATSPQLLDGFARMNALFEATTLDPLSREVLVLTMATRNGCHLCVALHTARLHELDADPEIIAALRAQTPLVDARLEAIRLFVLRVLATAGDVDDESMGSFLSAGYTPRNALEVVLGIGAYTTSTFANRMTKAPVDGSLLQYA